MQASAMYLEMLDTEDYLLYQHFHLYQHDKKIINLMQLYTENKNSPY